MSTTLCKLYELFACNEVRSKCLVPPHQFGFQQSVDCDHALYSIVSILVDAEGNNDTLVLLEHDLTRAFDSSFMSIFCFRQQKKVSKHVLQSPLTQCIVFFELD